MATESDTQFVQNLGELFNNVANSVSNSYASNFKYRTTKKLMALNQKYYKENMELAQGYNEKNMALQNQYAIDAENRANAYNDPSAQLARARAAGMNPQSVVSDAGVQGSISSSPDSSAPQGYSPSPHDVPFVTNPMRMDVSSLVELQKQQAEINLLDSQTRKNNADTQGIENQNSVFDSILKPTLEANRDNADALSKLNALKLDYQRAVQQTDIAIRGLDLAVLNQTLENYKKDGLIKDETVKQIQALTEDTKVHKDVLLKQIDEIGSRINLNEKEYGIVSEKLRRLLEGLPEGNTYGISEFPSMIFSGLVSGSFLGQLKDCVRSQFGHVKDAFDWLYDNLFKPLGVNPKIIYSDD